MIFTDLTYVVLLVLSVSVYWLLPPRARPWWLVVTGVAFYAHYAPWSLWVVIAVALATWALSRRASVSKAMAAAAALVPLLVLAWFKYRHMLPAAMLAPIGLGAERSASGIAGPIAVSPYLPLALSFFTFEFVHYALDSRKGSIERPPLRDFLAFAVFFPTMVAGPIKRFQHFREGISSARPAAADFGRGVTRILLGLVKKVVIADSLAVLVRPLTASMADPTFGALAVSLTAYSLRIYFDFSGYSDIAIGSARLFGYHAPENFDRPYLATNIVRFWRRWHMSLTSWIVDYVYIPLGGNRRGLPRTIVNSMIAMALSGLWHGADWHFVAWGAYHGALIGAYRLWEAVVRPRTLAKIDRAEGFMGRTWAAVRPLRSAACTATTFALVTFGWGLFALPVSEFAALLEGAAHAGVWW